MSYFDECFEYFPKEKLRLLRKLGVDSFSTLIKYTTSELVAMGFDAYEVNWLIERGGLRDDRTITPEIARNIRARGLLLQPEKEYSDPRIKEIAKMQKECMETMNGLDVELIKMAEAFATR